MGTILVYDAYRGKWRYVGRPGRAARCRLLRLDESERRFLARHQQALMAMRGQA